MNFNFDLKDLKRKVGIEDVAYHLGYRVNKAAGVGRYVEMTLTDAHGDTIDAIVINTSVPRERQMFFHRTTGLGGDVIELIKENINAFNVQAGKNVYDTVGRVMAKLANLPVDGQEQTQRREAARPAPAFNAARFDIVPADQCIPRLMAIFHPRGISRETVETFSPHLVKITDKEAKYKYENLGFPYRRPGSADIVGAEWRGQFGKKGKAAGTNSSSAAWIADFSSAYGSSPMNARNVYFAESGFDIMAFYQANKASIDLPSSVFVSLGGSFSEKQVAGIMSLYSGAKAWDCFDNDLPGRLYGVRMAAIVEGKALSYSLTDDKATVIIGFDGKSFAVDAEKVGIEGLRRYAKLQKAVGTWKAPERYKDWNDCVMNVPLKEAKELKSKFQMIDRLRSKRTGNQKI